MGITIVGLGPGDPELLTRRAWQILSEASEVYLRTARHPGIEALPAVTYHNFDDWYDRAENFESLYQQIAAQIVTLGIRPEGVVYAVPGHPLVGESTVTTILALAKAQAIPVTIIDGLSFIEPTLSALALDGLDGIQIHDAAAVAGMHHPPLDPDVPAILAQVYSHTVAADVKLTLTNQYPDEHPVILIHGAGTPTAKLESIPLYELDRSTAINHLTSLYVPPLPRSGSFEAFQEVIAHLRAPEGCPWDRKQTHQSLRKYLLEESYEVLEALDADDMDALREELGDLLLQIVLHSQIAVEAGEFGMADVLDGVISKMIRRHPHVWGEVAVKDANEVVVNWEQIKQREKAARGETSKPTSIFDGIPQALPALAQATAYHDRAANTGFDWSDIREVVEKLNEEVEELLTADSDVHRMEELGDVLSVVVNIARWSKVDPETALRQGNQKFARRFRYIEQHAGRDLKELTVAEMNALWDAAKVEEKVQAAK